MYTVADRLTDSEQLCESSTTQAQNCVRCPSLYSAVVLLLTRVMCLISSSRNRCLSRGDFSLLRKKAKVFGCHLPIRLVHALLSSALLFARYTSEHKSIILPVRVCRCSFVSSAVVHSHFFSDTEKLIADRLTFIAYIQTDKQTERQTNMNSPPDNTTDFNLSALGLPASFVSDRAKRN